MASYNNNSSLEQLKIIIAVDSFKGSLSSSEIFEIMSEEIEKQIKEKQIAKNVQLKKYSIADGGEGTVEAFVEMTGGKYVYLQNSGPLMKKIDTKYGLLGDKKTVVIDMASSCALTMVNGEERNPMNTTTFGVGEQIVDALNKGYRNFILGLGGACTNDGGMGMLQSLGVTFIGEDGKPLANGGGGKQLNQIRDIDLSRMDKRLTDCKFTIASDVTNPLYGKNGAAYVYAPQKGATPEMVEELDKGLRNFSAVIKRKTGVDISEVKGSGAAGGIGGGIVAFLNSEMRSGIELLLLYSDYEKELLDTDFVITGEGKIDSQTLNGKAPYVITKKAKEKNVCVIGVCGKKEIDEKDIGMDVIYEISDNSLPLEVNMANAKENMKATSLKIGDYISKRI